MPVVLEQQTLVLEFEEPQMDLLVASLACAALSQASLAIGVARDTELSPVVVSGSASR